MLGALSGALITGYLALKINKIEMNRNKEIEKEKSMNTQKLLMHYANLMYFEYKVLGKLNEKFDLTNEYYDNQKNKSNKELIKNPAVESALKFINEYRKLNEINLDNLKSEQLDEYLIFISWIKSNVLPKMDELQKNGKINLHEEEIKITEKVFERFLHK